MTTLPWAIVLAAGAGRRLATVTAGIPKQFWRPDGRPTLLDDTLARFAPVAPPSRTVVIADATHRAHTDSMPGLADRARLLYQPRNRGTAAGVLFALTPVLERRPDAIVAITPCDHGVGQPAVFLEGLRAAIAHVRATDSVVLGAAQPDRATADYGWILPADGNGRESAERIRAVGAFVEKPEPDVARALFDAGGVWNTMVLVARARTLQGLYQTHLPELADVFGRALSIPERDRDRFLTQAYERLRSYDFSQDLLAVAEGLSTYVWPATVKWSDLGTPDRLREWSITIPPPASASNRGATVAA